MIPLAVVEVAALLDASLTDPGDPTALITAVIADSRSVEPGALFVALPGTRVDGQAFVPGAYAAGAVAALTRGGGTRSALPGRRRPTGRPRPAGAGAGRSRPDRRPAGGGHHRLAGQNLHQGSIEPGPRGRRPDGRPGRQPQQRARRAVDRVPDRARDPLPGRRDGRARYRPHRLSVPDRAAVGRGRAQRRPGAPRRIRREGRHRPGQGRTGRGTAEERGGGTERGRPPRLGHAGAHCRRSSRLRRRPATTRSRRLVQRRHGGCPGATVVHPARAPGD